VEFRDGLSSHRATQKIRLEEILDFFGFSIYIDLN
jgi:hypothetical protein